MDGGRWTVGVARQLFCFGDLRKKLLKPEGFEFADRSMASP